MAICQLLHCQLLRVNVMLNLVFMVFMHETHLLCVFLSQLLRNLHLENR